MKLFKPSNLVFERDIVGYEKKYHEKYAWIIHKILDEKANHQQFNGYVNLKQCLLRHFAGERYCLKIIGQLKNSGIIEVNDAYSAGKFSKSYRLTRKYEHVAVSLEPLEGSKKKAYLRKLNSYHSGQLKHLLTDTTLQQMHYNLGEVALDYSSAFTYAEKMFSEGALTSDQYNSCIMMVEKIRTKDTFFTRDDKTGRVYHNLANLPKPIRCFASYQGQPLYQVDISCSQPLLFCKLLDTYLKEVLGVSLIQSPKEPSKSTILAYTTTSISTPYVETVYSYLPKDVALYRELTSKSKFYEYLMAHLGISEDERNDFKVDFFKRIFYSKPGHMLKDKYAQKFKELFPTVYDAVLWYKQTSHADLAINLMAAESEIVLKKVCNTIVTGNAPSKRPFFFTIHDAIICLEKDAPYIKGLLEQELMSSLGFMPKVKIDPFYKGTQFEPDNKMNLITNAVALPLKLSKNGFIYTQVLRGHRSCIYEQRVSEKTRYFEVFVIRLSQEKLLPSGKILPVKEKFPSNEDFGIYAWTYPSLESAKKKFDELEAVKMAA